MSDMADLTARVQAIVGRRLRPDAPGAAVLVLADDAVVYAAGRGMADLRRRTPITGRTLFELASASKQFTAAAALTLAGRGRLDLDADARLYLPELPVYDLRRPIRVTDLLWHTSGLPDYLDEFRPVGYRGLERLRNLDVLERLRGRPLAFPTGKWADRTAVPYSNTNYVLLALIVERAGGAPFARFLADGVFATAGMTATRVYDDPTQALPGRARGYAPGFWGFRLYEKLNRVSGDGNVWSNVDDLARWVRRLRALRGGAWARLFEKGRLDDGRELNYGGGLRVQRFRGLPLYGHGGKWTGFRSYLGLFAEGRLAAAVLCNHRGIDAEAIADEIAADCLVRGLG
jgi:CubicO group peptidase (beta-lactamase class C family)